MRVYVCFGEGGSFEESVTVARGGGGGVASIGNVLVSLRYLCCGY